MSTSIEVAPDQARTMAQLSEENALLREELRRLREAERTLGALLDNAPVLISAKALDGTILMASRHFEILDGYDAAAFVGRKVFDLFPPDIAEQLWRNDQRAAAERRPIHEEETVYHRDQSLHTYATVKFPLFDDDNAVIATCAVSTDITDVRAAQADSLTDELTGLKNRRYFNMRFVEEQRRAQRDQRLLTLLLADVDRFKGYNDTHGHPQGDVVLGAVAQAIRRTLNRPGDLSFRLGGDEFACLFTANGEEESEELAERIRAALAAEAIPHLANDPYGTVTLSIGLAFLYPHEADDTLTQGAAYERGDQALYRAKHKGRNTVSR
ncbi:GGDEF domain-containing protein [Massilia sp. CCM 9210]|uniref:sensor domain-containing diguanylate cyclase n=1 Tax=Massilia scottii TaxID=3057166 RepID=UPI002796C458|nr:GGDEF domain-containing protein [Massilia sp. CCM 9210]MDQ1816274.1 GGDEF domain-containing protein [Massilia sp. CCM 9210]